MLIISFFGVDLVICQAGLFREKLPSISPLLEGEGGPRSGSGEVLMLGVLCHFCER